jgi:serine O-acetyltransferase
LFRRCAPTSRPFERDPACHSYLDAFLFYKGFHALECYRVAHWLWRDERGAMALFLQSRISQLFAVDVHPAAKIGRGIMFDHATGIVIGETAVVEDDVSIMQDVTLGGTGKESGDVIQDPPRRAAVLCQGVGQYRGPENIAASARFGGVSSPAAPPWVPAKLVNCTAENPSAMNHSSRGRTIRGEERYRCDRRRAVSGLRERRTPRCARPPLKCAAAPERCPRGTSEVNGGCELRWAERSKSVTGDEPLYRARRAPAALSGCPTQRGLG